MAVHKKKPDSERSCGNNTILLVDDDPVFVYSIRQFLLNKGLTILTAASVNDAIEIVNKHEVKLVLLDVYLPDDELGFRFFEYLRGGKSCPMVIIITGSQAIKHTINALRLGAVDYLLKPVELEVLWEKIQRFLHMPSSSGGGVLDDSIWSQLGLIGVSPRLAELLRLVRSAARTNMNILITGETGTGKELCARAVHMLSSRSAGPFVPVNCAALGDGVFQAEIFGYKKGSFTGADETHKGYIEVAEGGTLFMDEIGEVPLAAQAKILRAIETGEFNPMGETRAKKADARYIAATNRNLLEEVAAGRFREDLYYRLNVMEIHLPPLRERQEDIPSLVEHNIGRLSQGLQKPVKGASPALISELMGYSWPGNVRQLLNMLARAIALSGNEVLGVEDFPVLIGARHEAQVVLPLNIAARAATKDLEYDDIREALAQAKGNVNNASQLLNIHMATLYRKTKKYAIDLGQFRNP